MDEIPDILLDSDESDNVQTFGHESSEESDNEIKNMLNVDHLNEDEPTPKFDSDDSTPDEGSSYTDDDSSSTDKH